MSPFLPLSVDRVETFDPAACIGDRLPVLKYHIAKREVDVAEHSQQREAELSAPTAAATLTRATYETDSTRRRGIAMLETATGLLVSVLAMAGPCSYDAFSTVSQEPRAPRLRAPRVRGPEAVNSSCDIL